MTGFNVITPNSSEELMNIIGNSRISNFRIGAGMTDLLVELKKQDVETSDFLEKSEVLNLNKIKDPFFKSIEFADDYIYIGALVTATEIINNPEIKKELPVLHKAAESMASRQIRQVATVGGNICTASPAGDIAAALVALEAVCEILSSENTIRDVPINEFFTGVRKNVLKINELLRRVFVPKTSDFLKKSDVSNEVSDFIKIGTRKSMECAIVSLAYRLLIDNENIIRHAGISIGSSAPTIKYTNSACDYLIGKNLSEITDSDKEIFANKVLEYASPISDVRGSAWYRRKVLYNISRGILENGKYPN